MTTRVQIGSAILLQGDWRDLLPAGSRFDALVTDPPYGIGEAAGKNRSRGKLAVARDYGDDDWDNEPPTSAEIDRLLGLAQWVIMFGGNYFALPASSCWLVWDKEINGDFADCELAWTNLPKAVRRIRYMWNGMLRANKEPRGDHPTQKPLEVMRWSINQLPSEVLTICDPYAGSGTTGVAALSLGKRFVGIEKESKYFDAMCRRVEQADRQDDLFIQSARV